jgi:HAD superfamily phosphoserine phosphatase-like hydrolase
MVVSRWSHPPRPISAVVMDFDGAICPQDVSEELFDAFAEPGWRELDDKLLAGRLTLRQTLREQVELLRAGRDEMLTYALNHFSPHPSFVPFVRWAQGAGLELAVASDGLGFYIEPMLRAAGVAGVAVHTNEFRGAPGDGSPIGFPNGHPRCVGCGTCKMNAVLGYRERSGPVAFVGEGYSDRYGAVFADLTFARDLLADLCRTEGVPFTPWETFDDVRRALEAIAMARSTVSGPVAPAVCPGWTEPRGGAGVDPLSGGTGI